MGKQKLQGQGKELKKHIAAIHCANTLSLLQRKISNALLYHAYPELQSREEHEITVKQLCNIIGYSGNNHAVIKEALKDLISTVIEWNIVDQATGEEDWTASSILASVNIKGAICRYAYSPRMKLLLHSPAMYGKINLIIQSQFKSSYGLALYENCVRYKGLPSTKWFDLSIFRKLMGVPADKYKIFRDFKKRVLDKSVEEVNTYADLIVVPEINRVGHKVLGIRFKLKTKDKKQPLGIKLTKEAKEGEGDSFPSLAKLVDEFGLVRTQAQRLIAEYGITKVMEKIALVEETISYKQGRVENLAAYLLSALREDYQLAKSSRHKTTEKRRQVLKDEQGKQEVLKQQYEQYVIQKIEAVIQQASTDHLQAWELAFKAHLDKESNKFMIQKYQRHGLDNGITRAYFRHFIKETYVDLFTHIPSFDGYVTQHLTQEA